MIKAQDIRGITFEKAVFGGYDMASVDAFMEDLANDLGLLQKENAVLRAKMKVLVDKVDEYRSNEDALRTALLTAQKMGLSIEREAREKADALLAEAQAEAGLEGSLPEKAPPPCAAIPPYVSTMILRPVSPESPHGPPMTNCPVGVMKNLVLDVRSPVVSRYSRAIFSMSA